MASKWETQEDVEKWVAANGGIEALRLAIARRTLGEERMRLAEMHLERIDREAAGARTAEASENQRRQTAAMEEQTEHAKEANRLARAALVISIIALVIAGYAAVLGAR